MTDNETTRAKAVETAIGAPWGINNLLGWSWDPIQNGAGEVIKAGELFVTKIRVTPGVTLSKLLACISTKGTTLTAGENFGMLFAPFGANAVLIGTTEDQHAAWEAAGEYEMPLTAHEAGSLVIPTSVNWLYGAVLGNGTTMPTFRGPAGAPNSAVANAGLAAASGLRGGVVLSGQTTPPASFPLASVVPFSKPSPWLGVS